MYENYGFIVFVFDYSFYVLLIKLKFLVEKNAYHVIFNILLLIFGYIWYFNNLKYNIRTCNIININDYFTVDTILSYFLIIM